MPQSLVTGKGLYSRQQKLITAAARMTEVRWEICQGSCPYNYLPFVALRDVGYSC